MQRSHSYKICYRFGDNLNIDVSNGYTVVNRGFSAAIKLWSSFLALVVISFFPSWSGKLSAQEIIQQKLRPGSSHSLLLLQPTTKPKHAVILFAGGHGMVEFEKDGRISRMRGNFLVRSRKLFVNNGLLVGIYSMPAESDDWDFRLSNTHAEDVGKLIRDIKLKYQVDVWLIGHSRGSISVANAGLKLKGSPKPTGLIFAASVVDTGNRGQPKVTDLEVEDINIPSLVIHHRDDNCYVTLHSDAKYFFKKLKNSPRKEFVTMEGGEAGWEEHACKSKSHHGFLDIEKETVKRISDWIKSAR